MASQEPSILPIVAALDEADAIAGIVTDKVVSEIVGVVGSGELIELAVQDVECELLFLGDSRSERAMARMIQAICRTLSGSVDAASGLIGDLLRGASENINDVLNAVSGLVDDVTESIVQSLQDVVGAVADRLDQSLRSIIETAETVVQSIANFLADMIDRIAVAVSDILSGIGFAVSELIRVVTTSFDALLSSAGRLIERIDKTVREIGEFLVDLASDTLEQMSLTIAAVLGPLIGAGQSVVARIGDLIESVPGAVVGAAEALTEGIGKFVGTPLDKLGSIFVTQVEEFFADLIEDGQLSHGEILRTLLTRLGAPAEAIEDIALAADEATPSTPGFTAMALAFLIPLIIAQFVGAAMEPLAEQTRQKIGSSIHQTLLSPLDLLDGLFKGDIDEERFRTDFEQAGYTEERVASLQAIFRHAPDVQVHIQAWLRELIDEDELDTALAANRLRGNDIALLKKVVFFVPPAQDLIRMAVREVFSPDVRQRFGQDEDFPEEFAKFAAQQGISDEWARNYWAAHWALPSPAQGFEMLHRGVIEIEDLNVLLRALDVMPFWRDKLTAIAFNPLTRVDLRRMHALGLLSDEEIQTRYQAIGFSAEDAALMVAFTVAFNASDEETVSELDGITRASVLGFFSDGLITRDDAIALLAGMGIGSDAAELFVESRELDIGRGERRALIESIVELAGGGIMNLPDAQDQLAQIGLTAVEIAIAVKRILGRRDSRDRLPSLADLLKMRNASIIDDEVYLDSIKASGFNDEWADRVFALATGEEVA